MSGTPAAGAPLQAAGRGGWWARSSPSLRVLVWVFHMALPLLGLWLLIAQPEADVVWEHHPTHFWLVVGVAALNVALGARISEAARRRSDARLFLVSLAFLSSAGFLFLHALATPGVLLSRPNGGFVIATPVGLALASVFAAASSIDFGERASARVMRFQSGLRAGLVALMVGWAVVSLLDLPPLRYELDAEVARGPFVVLTSFSVLLYSVAAARYYALYRRRPAVMLIGVTTAFVLLAEAMIAIVFARSWQASWWEWHVLMAAGFAYVAYSAQVHYRREGSATGLFNSISLEQTIGDIRREYGAALEALVDAMRRGEELGGDENVELIALGLAHRFGLTEGQTEVLVRAAEALVGERDQIRRLGALVAIGQETRVMVEEPDLLARAVAQTGAAFQRDSVRVGLVREGRIEFPPELTAGHPGPAPPEDEPRVQRALSSLRPVEEDRDGDHSITLPLEVKGRAAGLLEVHRSGKEFAERDRSVLESLASQLSIALENTRLYRQIDSLFRQYMSPDVATALIADPSQAALGGAIVEVTVLFADLTGFTTYSERSTPQEVVGLLNHYFGTAVPLIVEQGGTICQFVGDEVMALFNAPTRQRGHALKAAWAALKVQAAINALADENPGHPRFRVGINTGPALVGNIGSREMRNFTAIGDTTNLASRLEGLAPAGGVVIGARTEELVRGHAEVRPLGPVQVKGKQVTVEAFELLRLRSDGVGPAAGEAI